MCVSVRACACVQDRKCVCIKYRCIHCLHMHLINRNWFCFLLWVISDCKWKINFIRRKWNWKNWFNSLGFYYFNLCSNRCSLDHSVETFDFPFTTNMFFFYFWILNKIFQILMFQPKIFIPWPCLYLIWNYIKIYICVQD